MTMPLLPLTKMVWPLPEYGGMIKQAFTRSLNKPLSDEWKWVSESLLDSRSDIEATQLAWNDGVGNVLLAKAIPSFRTSLENSIKLLNVYHISFFNVSIGIALATIAMSGSTVSTMLTEVFQSLESALLLVSAGHLSTVPVYVVHNHRKECFINYSVRVLLFHRLKLLRARWHSAGRSFSSTSDLKSISDHGADAFLLPPRAQRQKDEPVCNNS